MHPLAILRVGRDGRITGRSEGAASLFGRVLGRSCHRVVGAVGADGSALCRPGCAEELLGDAAEPTSDPQARSLGGACQLECRKVGSEVVVVIGRAQSCQSPAGQALSPRQQQSLVLVAKGLTRDQIARRLGLKPSTVRTHLEHAREKLGARNSAQAAALWLARNSPGN